MKPVLRFVLLLLVSIVSLKPDTSLVIAQSPEPTKIFLPLVISSGSTGQPVPNQYVVTFRDDMAYNMSDVVQKYVDTYGVSLVYTYEDAVRGFVINVPTQNISQTLSALADDPLVEFVEQDRYITIDNGEYSRLTVNQPNPTWGLDRIDQRNLPLNQNYVYNFTGAGVRVYIIDTGIRTTHNEFGGRAISGLDAIDGSLPADDCNGHGTHVAGTVGGSVYGVAKGAQLVAVRVLGCNGSGTYSGVIAGVNWVTNQKHNNPSVPMVANMSLGGIAYAPLDQAIANSIASGVTYVVSAGNSNADACNQSPACAPMAITVGATTSTNARANYSNYGQCLDIFAPGSSITSAWNSSNSATATLNGTSMASPHVAGVAALYLQSNSNALPAAVTSAIVSNSTMGIVSNPGNQSPNRLIYSLLTSTPTALPTTISGDINGDGRGDLVWNILAGTQNRVYVGLSNANGTFNFLPHQDHPDAGWSGYQVLAGDINGDGRDDLIWNTLISTQNRVYVGLSDANGTFNFLPYQNHPDAGWDGYRVLVADINGDSRNDLVWNKPAGTQNRVYVGLSNANGTFNFLSYQDHPAMGWNGYKTLAGDINGDGRDDLIWNTLVNTHNRVYVGLSNANGTINFLPYQNHPNAGWSGYQVLTSDINGDGRKDLVWDKTVNIQNRVYVGLSNANGTLNFLPYQDHSISH